MKLQTLIFRNLIYFRRTNLAIIAGVGIAVAVFSGALLVGQSVRESLRQLLYERIGLTDYVVSSNQFFEEALANSPPPGFKSCPIIFLKGVITHEATGLQARNVNVYGIDEKFWIFHGDNSQSSPTDRAAQVGSALARQLNIQNGDGLLLRVETPAAIPREWLYGRRDTTGKTIRLNCAEVIPESQLGEFALHPSQGNVFSIFVPIQRLQKDLGQTSRINAILLSRFDPGRGIQDIRGAITKRCTLADLGLRLRDVPSNNSVSLESDRIILDDFTAEAASGAAVETGLPFSPLYTYLANSIRANGKDIPYSVITAGDIGKGALTSVHINTGNSLKYSPPGESEAIWLTDWAVQDLGVRPGDPVEIDYYLWKEAGQLITSTARFRLAGIVPIAGDVNASLAPEIPGVTEARSISAWDPPFPLELSRIRREDENFWDQHKATPKAFIALARGQRLWSSRFGKITAMRVALPEGTDPGTSRNRFTAALLRRLDPEKSGFSIEAVRDQGLAASRGSTDFGEYFVYFSSFLIAASILLASMFFKLMIEQRAREIGVLSTVGFHANDLRRIFLLEGISLSAAGSILGLGGAIGYGWLMVFGLRTWWIGAVGTRHLTLHISWPGLVTGIVAGIFFSVIAMLWTLRALGRNSPRVLLSGVLESAAIKAKRRKALIASAFIFLLVALLLLFLSYAGKMPQLEGFFGSGFLLLISMLCATDVFLHRREPRSIRGNGWRAFCRLGIRNAMYRPGRSLVCATLIASATFIVLSMEAFRQDPRSISLDFKSGTGGYPLMAEAAIPIINDPNSKEGREAMGLSGMQTKGSGDLQFTSFRERPGDDVSCLNLYAPQEPQILGAPHAFIDAGRFSFQNSLAINETERQNPWLLLETYQDSSVIPAIADANTIQYILHLSLGKEIAVRAQNGTVYRLRLVAALRDSIFQGEVLIAESAFLRIFPEHEGYRFFLLSAPTTGLTETQKLLQESLSDWGFSVEPTQQRLASYHRVENTYLSTFQSLGALGLLLGTAGLAAVLLRNVLERRSELALLRAAGYSLPVLSTIIVLENVILLSWGLVSGTVCAFLAIVPAIQSRGVSIPFGITAPVLLSVFAAGLISSLLAVVAAVRSPLLSALHSE